MLHKNIPRSSYFIPKLKNLWAKLINLAVRFNLAFGAGTLKNHESLDVPNVTVFVF